MPAPVEVVVLTLSPAIYEAGHAPVIGQSDKAGGIRDNVRGYSAACFVKMPSRSGGAGVILLLAESMKLGRTMAG